MRNNIPVSARAEALRGLVDEYRRALVGSQSHTPVTSYGGYPERVAAARARLDAELAAVVADSERLDVLDSLDTDALAMVTGRALDGDSLRYLADIEIEQRARAATPTGGSDAR